MNCDLLIIGAGMAGMTAAARASHLGLKTIQVGSSAGLLFNSGMMDILGVYPVEESKVLASPDHGLDRLRNDLPGHPYAKVNNDTIKKSLKFVQKFLSLAGPIYDMQKDHNVMVLTSAGTFNPSYLIPQTFGKGQYLFSDAPKLLITDFKG